MVNYRHTEDFGGMVITDGLLQHLDEMFPDKLPTLLVSEPEVSKLIGQQQVIRWLKDKQEEIKAEAYKGETSVRVT